MAQRKRREPRAVVVGGGIGGLAAAVALEQAGWQVTVLERAPSLEPVGAAISLTPNALRALDVVGIGEPIRDLAAWQGEGGMFTPSGRRLARMDSRAVAERFGGPIVLLPRATLVDTLAARLSETAVRTDSAASLADPGEAGGRPARVTTADGELEADLVVGADGIGSSLRAALFPHHPGAVYSGFTTWRLMIPVPGVEFTPGETWGRGRLWGTQPLKDGRIYAYAAAVTPEGGRAPDDEKAELLRLFGDWHRPVPDILAAARPEDVLRHDVHHIAPPLPAYHLGRVALLGDAAHAMPPTLGQGGNQAIEDAVVLAHHAGRPDDLADGLARYTDARLARTTSLVRKAVQAGRMAMPRNRAVIAARNAVITAVARTGPGVLLRSFAGVADWQPPRPPYAAAEVTTGQGPEKPATGDGREQPE